MTYHRLSIPGNLCALCGEVVGESLICPGCGWVDPLTKPLPASEGHGNATDTPDDA